jgi:AcrR family transcriptional regulator
VSSSVAVAADAPRRALSDRRARTVERLTEAAVAELVEVGYGALTVRGVAKRAGVAAATAYTYFASKEHLVAEVFWRRFLAQPEPDPADPRPTAERVGAVVNAFALVVADQADLSAACTVAVLADDPDVAYLRERIGVELHRRLTVALGPAADAAVVQTLQFATSGALLQAGTGHLAHGELPAVLARIVAVVLGGRG